MQVVGQALGHGDAGALFCPASFARGELIDVRTQVLSRGKKELSGWDRRYDDGYVGTML